MVKVEWELKNNRFRIDGWIFEWIISDYHDNDDLFSEEGVLLIAREDNAEDVQVIHVQGEGEYATWVSTEDKFVYTLSELQAA